MSYALEYRVSSNMPGEEPDVVLTKYFATPQERKKFVSSNKHVWVVSEYKVSYNGR